MERKVTLNKESKLSLPEQGKESIQQRLRELMRDRSLRRVSLDWGLPYSTINNYFTKGTTPSVEVITTVADIENVSIEWLITGKSREAEEKRDEHKQDRVFDELESAWMTAFKFMNKGEAEALLRIIISGGAKGLIKLAGREESAEERFLLLPAELKARAIELIDAHVEAKKGASEGSELSNTGSPASDQKQAS